MNTLLLLALLGAPGITPENLRCEYRVEPRGVDVRLPRLSWTVASAGRAQWQSAYQILVASAPAKLDAAQADLWDSGKVESHESMNIPYAGKPPASHQRCYWKVRVWDKGDNPSEWSPAASWSMGNMKAEDWHAAWIAWSRTALNSGPLPMFRRDFTVARKITRATAYICGLGFLELYLNGRKVGDHVLEPGWTNYRRTNLYATYEVGGFLHPGPNALGAVLGNGMYNVAGGRLIKHARYYRLLLTESRLTRCLFGANLRRIASLPLTAGRRTADRRRFRRRERQGQEKCPRQRAKWGQFRVLGFWGEARQAGSRARGTTK